MHMWQQNEVLLEDHAQPGPGPPRHDLPTLSPARATSSVEGSRFTKINKGGP